MSSGQESLPPATQTAQPARAPDRAALVGRRVRVVARRGYVVEGVCLDAWRLRNGGTALTVKPMDGSSPRELTTLLPIVVVSDDG